MFLAISQETTGHVLICGGVFLERDVFSRATVRTLAALKNAAATTKMTMRRRKSEANINARNVKKKGEKKKDPPCVPILPYERPQSLKVAHCEPVYTQCREWRVKWLINCSWRARYNVHFFLPLKISNELWGWRCPRDCVFSEPFCGLFAFFVFASWTPDYDGAVFFNRAQTWTKKKEFRERASGRHFSW